MDMYQTLLGGDRLKNEDTLRATAEALRNKSDAAEMFSMSTIGSVAKPAAQRVQSLKAAALRGGRARQIEREQQLREDRLDAGIALEDERRADDRAWDREKLNTMEAGRDARAKLKGTDTKSPYSRISSKELGDYTGVSVDAENIMHFIESSNTVDEMTGEIPQLSSGKSGALGAGLDRAVNAMAPSYATNEQKVRAAWWKDYRMQLQALRRHEMFGSALTETEKQSWKEMSISEKDDEVEIRKNLARQKEFVKNKVRAETAKLQIRGMPDKDVQRIFGDTGYSTFFGDTPAGTESDPVGDIPMVSEFEKRFGASEETVMDMDNDQFRTFMEDKPDAREYLEAIEAGG